MNKRNLWTIPASRGQRLPHRVKSVKTKNETFLVLQMSQRNLKNIKKKIKCRLKNIYLKTEILIKYKKKIKY